MIEISGYGYKCAAGETFDSVALVLFGDEKYAAELMCANPEHTGKMIFDGSELLFVPVINIPDETDEAATGSAPWKE